MRLPEETGIIYHIAVRISHEVFETHIYPNGKIGVWQLHLCLNLAREDHIEVATLTLDRGSLRFSDHGPMLLDFDMTNLGKHDLAILDGYDWLALEPFDLGIREAIVAII